MKCLIITPVGPGHGELVETCRQSVRQAVATSTGPFSDILHFVIDDTKGLAGRSAARNHGIVKALELDADWMFFLDADDLMAEVAFAAVAPYVTSHDAVWGQICELLPGSPAPQLRPDQVVAISSFNMVLEHDPFFTLQIGHFVRTRLAAQFGFDPTMDCGEDVKFYCEEWSRGRCIKVPEVFFINRRGLASVGPRSADGQQWWRRAEAVLAGYRRRYSVLAPSLPIA